MTADKGRSVDWYDRGPDVEQLPNGWYRATSPDGCPADVSVVDATVHAVVNRWWEVWSDGPG